MQVESYSIDSKPSRKGKERDSLHRDANGPQPTDIDEKLTALRRRNAAMTRPRDKSERDRTHLSQPHQPSASLSILSITPQQQQPSTSSSSLQRSERPERSPKLTIASSGPRQPPPSPRRYASPHVLVSRPTQDADHEDFSRRLKISSSPAPRPSSSTQKLSSSHKLYNPNTDPIPMRRTAEPEQSLEADNPSHVPRNIQSNNRGEDRGSSRQLFDHRKDDPVRFSVLTRPQLSQGGRTTPISKASADYVSISSNSSYAPSVVSSAFTLSSATDASSASSALFDQQPGPGDESTNNAFSIQLKKLYRGITALEAKVQSDDDVGEETTRVMLKGKKNEHDEVEKEKWRKRIGEHKELAELIHTLLTISLAPTVPASLRNIPVKYNIIIRLWTFGFHKLLESLRHSSFTSPVALEHLQEVIYYAYTFYTGLLEEPTLRPFKAGWLEALGDLARYRMAVAAMVNGGIGGQGGLTQKALIEVSSSTNGVTRPTSNGSVKSISDAPAARIDDSPSPSIGLAAARLLYVEPEKERWRNVARDWYGTGLTDQPGTGKLHHHLGLLSREAEGEELRAVYHFVKGMTTLQPFATSRESVLPIWAPTLQAKRALPDARASDLFVRIHGMLFTNIQLDDFQPTCSRFIERLEIEGAQERDWIMMAVTNIASVLDYGRSNVLKSVGGAGVKEANGSGEAAAMRVMAKKAAAGVPGSSNLEDESKMDVDQDQNGDTTTKSPANPSAGSGQLGADAQPLAFKYALQLTFAMLTCVLRNPERRTTQFSTFSLNPYLTIILTFLATILKHKPTADVLERSIPWADLATFFTKAPRKIMISQGLMPPPGKMNSRLTSNDRWIMLTSGCQPPLPEDWCIRGMEWVGRKVFERGYWKTGDENKMELDIIQSMDGIDVTDGAIEDDDERNKIIAKKASSDLTRRWIRIVRCGVQIADAIEGFGWVEGTRDWRVQGKLKDKVEMWREEDIAEREEEERRRMGRRWVDDSMDIDEDNNTSDEESEDDENDSPEIRELKERRRELRKLLQAQSTFVGETSRRARGAAARPLLPIVPGYTALVVDTNVLLSALSIFSTVIESLRWTVVVPLPVIMELEGLSKDPNNIGAAAKAALSYLSSHVRSHALSLKIQTSRGNYLTNLNVRTEQVDFSDKTSPDQTMDDLILKAAFWHEDHWVDRTSMLRAPAAALADRQSAVKVVLLSFDRNMRLKARSRQLPTASEKDFASILSKTTT